MEALRSKMIEKDEAQKLLAEETEVLRLSHDGASENYRRQSPDQLTQSHCHESQVMKTGIFQIAAPTVLAQSDQKCPRHQTDHP
jgi:hypothetical protein